MGPDVDITPLLEGLEDDLCQVPHWGYIVDGSMKIRYKDGTEEVNEAGEAVYWPPGHTMLTEDEGVELVLISPERASIRGFGILPSHAELESVLRMVSPHWSRSPITIRP